jgi:hypothetical protein
LHRDDVFFLWERHPAAMIEAERRSHKQINEFRQKSHDATSHNLLFATQYWQTGKSLKMLFSAIPAVF